MNSWSSAIDGRIRFTATRRSKPSTPKALALKTSAMPPTLIRSRSRYFPNGMGFFTFVLAHEAWDRRPIGQRFRHARHGWVSCVNSRSLAVRAPQRKGPVMRPRPVESPARGPPRSRPSALERSEKAGAESRGSRRRGSTALCAGSREDDTPTTRAQTLRAMGQRPRHPAPPWPAAQKLTATPRAHEARRPRLFAFSHDFDCAMSGENPRSFETSTTPSIRSDLALPPQAPHP